jgi:AraC-like DNA-binding protein
MARADNWRGSVTFADRFVRFEGTTGDNRPHSHIAAQVVVGQAVCVELADSTRLCGDAIVVRPHVRHRLLPITAGQVYLIEPTSDIGAALLASLPDDPAQLVDDAQQLLDRVFRARPAASMEPRLQAAIDWLNQAGPLQASLPCAAREVGLSPERLRAIAAHQLGMPLASWRRWAAIRRACLALGEGCLLADAAIAGGFSDQSHFTRTTRAMLGITPAILAKVMV